MKILPVFFAIVMFSQVPAQANDVFFKNQNRFVKTDLISVRGIPTVRFAGCQADPKLETATCANVAAIHQTEFAAMRTCENFKQLGRTLSYAGAGALALVLVVSTGGTAAAAFVGGTVGLGTSLIIENNVERKYEIYSEQTQKAANQTAEHQDYALYIELLNMTLISNFIHCDVSQAIEQVDLKPYRIKLSATQKRFLLSVSN